MNSKMFFIEAGEFVRHQKRSLLQETMSDYLGFSVDELLLNKDALIFGGSLRDIIAGDSQRINDFH